MAVSKRTRFEVLRRDNHVCRYCGAKAPDVTLTVDHVVPVALGGTDHPDNLVAACEDCNRGKASVHPDAPLVDDVKQDAIRWARAMVIVAKQRTRARKKRDAYVDAFRVAWDVWSYGPDRKPLPLPADWRESLGRFYDLGVPVAEIEHYVSVAGGNNRVNYDSTFRYFAGCVWRALEDMHEAAHEVLATEEVS